MKVIQILPLRFSDVYPLSILKKEMLDLLSFFLCILTFGYLKL